MLAIASNELAVELAVVGDADVDQVFQAALGDAAAGKLGLRLRTG